MSRLWQCMQTWDGSRITAAPCSILCTSLVKHLEWEKKKKRKTSLGREVSPTSSFCLCVLPRVTFVHTACLHTDNYHWQFISLQEVNPPSHVRRTLLWRYRSNLTPHHTRRIKAHVHLLDVINIFLVCKEDAGGCCTWDERFAALHAFCYQLHLQGSTCLLKIKAWSQATCHEGHL